MPRSHLTCLHFVLMSKEPGASVFSPAGVWRLLCREVFLTLSCTDAVPHVGGCPGAPKGGLSSRHLVTLHQCSSSPDHPTVSPALWLKNKPPPSQSEYRAPESLWSHNSCQRTEGESPTEWPWNKHAHSSKAITHKLSTQKKTAAVSLLFSETLAIFQSGSSSCLSNGSIRHWQAHYQVCVCVCVIIMYVWKCPSHTLSSRAEPSHSSGEGWNTNTYWFSIIRWFLFCTSANSFFLL